jgi:hypothetical protein
LARWQPLQARSLEAAGASSSESEEEARRATAIKPSIRGGPDATIAQLP